MTLTKAKNKNGTEVVGNIINSTAIKARDSKENTKVKHLLSYTHGLHPYYGLIDYAIECPDIPWTKSGTKVVIDDKSHFPKAIYKKASTYFTQDILDKLNTYMKSYFNYGTSDEEDEIFSEDAKPIKPTKGKNPKK